MIPIPLNTATRIGLNVLLFLAGVVALRLGESVIVPLLVALLLATVLGPAAYWLHTRLKIRWAWPASPSSSGWCWPMYSSCRCLLPKSPVS